MTLAIPRSVILEDLKVILSLSKIIHVESREIRLIYARNDEGLGVAIIKRKDFKKLIEKLHARKVEITLPGSDYLLHDFPIFLRIENKKHAFRAWDLYITIVAFRTCKLNPETYVSKDGLMFVYDRDTEICVLICPIKW